MRYVMQLLSAACLIGLSGCVANPVTGRQQLSLVSETTAINQSTVAYNAIVRQYTSQGRVVTDPKQVTRVRTITDKLIRQATYYRPETQNWPWEVQIIQESQSNAFCAAGGKMVIFTGLLNDLDLTDDELAQVMAHEVSHALLKHTVEAQSVGLMASILTAAVAATGKTAYDQDLRQLGADLTTTLAWKLPNSRGTEAEADSIGVELAAKAGFDPAAAVTLWQKMTAREGTSGAKPGWLRTHPAPADRIEALAARVSALEPIYVIALDTRGDVPISTRPAAAAATLVAVGVSPESLKDQCSSTSQVDRAACSGQIRTGMHKYDIFNALGSPSEQDSSGSVLRYGDRFIQLDSSDRLIRIFDRRP